MNDREQEYLRLLGVFHFVVAGFAILFALIPVIHLVIGVAMLTGGFHTASSPPPPGILAVVGALLVTFASIWILTGMTFAVCLVIAGRSLLRRRRYTFCLVMAGIACMFVPFGTVLGVLTILVLVRDSVRTGFEAPAVA